MSARVRLFGEFRSWSQSGVVVVSDEGARTVADLKAAISVELAKSAAQADVDELMAVSALAGEDRILLDHESLSELNMKSFALLPPVCGG